MYPANFHCHDNNMDNGQNRKTEWDVQLSLETEINVINFFWSVSSYCKVTTDIERMQKRCLHGIVNRLEKINSFQLFREFKGIA